MAFDRARSVRKASSHVWRVDGGEPTIIVRDVDELLPPHLYDYRAIPREAAFLAARAHAAYRQRGGERQMILPDFLIGAHALVEGCPLLSRDVRRYRQAYPGLVLITPEGGGVG